jgi:hypothetical protein
LGRGKILRWNKEKEIMQLFSKLRWQVILIAGLIAAVNPTVSQANPATAKPALVIESPRHDAGTHWEGEVVSHTFQVKNSGGEVLRILSVKPG